MDSTTKKPTTFSRFLFFWLFLVFFKFSAGLHFELVSPLGSEILPIWLVGLLIGGAAFVQLILDVPAGYLLDRYGYLKLLKLTTITFFVAGLFLIFGLTIPTYLASLFFSIFGWLFFGPGISAYVLTHAPKSIAGKFISFRDVFSSLGIVLAGSTLPFAMLLTVPQIGLLICSLFTIAFVFLFFAPKEVHSVHREQKLPTQDYYIKRTYLGTTLKAFKKLNPASTMLFLLDLSGAIFYGMIWFVVPLVIYTQQANSGVLGMGLGIFDFAIVVLGFLLGKLADRSNKRLLVFFGLLIFSVSGALIGFNFGWLFIIFGFLATTGDEMAGLSLWSWLHALDREHAADGVISGVISLGQDLGWAIGPVLAGVLYQLTGPSWAIVIGAIPIFLTWLFYQFLGGTHAVIPLDGHSIPRKPYRPRHKS